MAEDRSVRLFDHLITPLLTGSLDTEALLLSETLSLRFLFRYISNSNSGGYGSTALLKIRECVAGTRAGEPGAITRSSCRSSTSLGFYGKKLSDVNLC